MNRKKLLKNIMIKELNIKDNNESFRKHCTETDLDDCVEWNYVIENNSTLFYFICFNNVFFNSHCHRRSFRCWGKNIDS